MEEQREEAALVGGVLEEHGRGVLGRHQHHQRHVEVVRDGGEGECVVRVHDEEGGPPGEGEQVPREEAAVLLELARVLAGRLHVPLGAHQHPAHVVAGVLGPGPGGEAPVSRDVQEQRPVRRKLLVAGGEEDEKLRQRGFVQQVLVGVVPGAASPAILHGDPDRGGAPVIVHLTHLVLGLALQCLQHPEHVQGQLGELDLLAEVAHDDDLLEAERHHGAPLHGRDHQWAQAVREHEAVTVGIDHVEECVALHEDLDLAQHQRPLQLVLRLIGAGVLILKEEMFKSE